MLGRIRLTAIGLGSSSARAVAEARFRENAIAVARDHASAALRFACAPADAFREASAYPAAGTPPCDSIAITIVTAHLTTFAIVGRCGDAGRLPQRAATVVEACLCAGTRVGGSAAEANTRQGVFW